MKITKDEKVVDAQRYMMMTYHQFGFDWMPAFLSSYLSMGAISFTISDCILSHSTFVDGVERHTIVLLTYWTGIILIAMAGMTEQACLKCLCKAIKSDQKTAS